MKYNLSDNELPEGMESTDELMTDQGVWISGTEAVEMIESLISHISAKGVRFGVISNDYSVVITELKESLKFANRAKNENGMFNYSVVM